MKIFFANTDNSLFDTETGVNKRNVSNSTAATESLSSNQTFTSPYFGKEIRNPNSGLKEFQPVPFKAALLHATSEMRYCV